MTNQIQLYQSSFWGTNVLMMVTYKSIWGGGMSKAVDDPEQPHLKVYTQQEKWLPRGCIDGAPSYPFPVLLLHPYPQLHAAGRDSRELVGKSWWILR